MLKFVIRLDDACPTMNLERWSKMENLLAKYHIKPIVGIIPNCKDASFNYEENPHFWDKTALSWKQKNWIIALHGYEHNLNEKVRTEFSGLSYEEQERKIINGLKILRKQDLEPSCFFAPNHTYDKTTVEVLKKQKCIKFISDGYAYFPYAENGMMFMPSVFDSPHKISNHGIFTFVFHPNSMTDVDFKKLNKFIAQYKANFDIDIEKVLFEYSGNRRRFSDRLLHVAIIAYRTLKRTRR